MIGALLSLLWGVCVFVNHPPAWRPKKRHTHRRWAVLGTVGPLRFGLAVAWEGI